LGAATPTLLLASLREAVLTLAAALVAMAGALALDPEPGPAVLAVVLALSLSRSGLDRSLRGRVEAAVVLPVVGLGALGIGLLLKSEPWLGALAFTSAIAGGIWLRRFGPAGTQAGTLIALPCIVLLVVPRVHAEQAGPVLRLALPVLVALLALLSVSLFHALGQRIGWIEAPPLEPRRARATPTPVTADTAAAAAPNPAAPPRRLAVSTRQALQMAVALGAAFALGYLVFPGHWAWLVLTAYIVGSANRGRLDVVHKSVQRVLGAAAGTLVALGVGHAFGPGGPGGALGPAGTSALILLALFLGVWLRPLGYGWWALFVTVALALLQGLGGTEPLLGQRLGEIVVGALIGVAAACWVLPLRSSDVLRKRIGDALAALSEALASPEPAAAPRAAAFEAGLAGVARVGAPFRAVRWVPRRWWRPHPVDWVDELMACRAPALALIERGGAAPGAVRKSVGAARLALREPAQIQPALAALRTALAAGQGAPRAAPSGD